MNKFLAQMVMTIYNQTYGVSTIADLMARYNKITSDAMSNQVFASLILTIKSLAIGITVLLYLIDLMGKVTEKNFSTEQFFKATLRCVTAYMFIVNADIIVGYLINVGTSIVTSTPNIDTGYELFGTGDAQRQSKIMLVNGIAKIPFLTKMGYLIMSIIPWMLSLIGEVILQVVLISRMLEIIVLTTFAPMSICDIYREGTASPGVQYMKKMLALGMQVAVIIMINTAAQAIIATIVGSDTGASIAELLQKTDIGSTDIETALASGDLIFTQDSVEAFITALTGFNNLKVLGIMLARLGLVWNSMPLCEEITGAK